MQEPEVKTANFALLPCAPDVCQECATKHDPEMPHNQTSLYYQYRFYSQHGRWPTWDDAMAHCNSELQRIWKEAMGNLGIKA